MKTFVFVSTVLFSHFGYGDFLTLNALNPDFYASSSLQNNSSIKIAYLVNFSMDPVIYRQKVIGAELRIDESKKIIQLNIQFDSTNPTSQTISLPLIKKTKITCGVTTYLAELDEGDSSGSKQTILVTDNSTLECKTFIVSDQLTIVNYTINYKDFGDTSYSSELSGFSLKYPENNFPNF